jgi:small subunit ribosomal protein S3
VKVWICKGEVLGKRDLSPNVGAQQERQRKRPARMEKRR